MKELNQFYENKKLEFDYKLVNLAYKIQLLKFLYANTINFRKKSYFMRGAKKEVTIIGATIVHSILTLDFATLYRLCTPKVNFFIKVNNN